MSDSCLLSPQDFDEEFLALVEAYCAGAISTEDQSRLAARLESDQAALETFVVCLDFHARLQRWAGRTVRAPNPILAIGEAVPASPSLLEPQARSEFLAGGKAMFSAFLVSLIALAGLAWWLFAPSKPSDNSGLTPETVAEAKQVLPDPSAAQGSSGARGDPAAAVLSSVRSIRFDSGTIAVGLDKIGTMVIEGPADFQMLSPMRARLSKGKIRVRVSEATGRGFQVETPNGLVTDLGTEFLLGVSEAGKTDLAVIEGKVDFQVLLSANENQSGAGTSPERLIEGDGIKIDENGNIDRIVSIIRSNAATFRSGGDMASTLSQATIVEVSDNLQKSDTKKFYEIIPGGLCEDAKAYADRLHEWNGITTDGIPPYLVGADYVKTFNQYGIQKKLGICVTLARPAKLYVFLDARSTPPDWLEKDFRNTGDRIGLDAAYNKRFRHRTIEVGPANSIDEQFTIWEREIPQACTIRLGTNLGEAKLDPGPAMYGIAAVPLEGAKSPGSLAQETATSGETAASGE